MSRASSFLSPSRFLLASFLLTLPLRAARPEDPKVEGNWKWSWTDQQGTEHKRTLKIKKEGGKLEGVIIRDDEKETPIKDIRLEGSTIRIAYSAERDGQTIDFRYEGKVEGDSIQGTVQVGSATHAWNPKRERAAAAEGEGWIQLIKGKTLAESGWKLVAEPAGNHKDGWSIKDGVLSNVVPAGGGSIDIVHEKKLKDFELHVEFRIPKGSNSGVYLRGCYEIQVEDTHGRPVADNICGAVYGQKAPSENAALPAGEWQTFDITMIGNKVTVTHNGKKVIDGFEVKGKTGGALEKEVEHGAPGPLMLQGNHGSVDYRNIRIRPISARI